MKEGTKSASEAREEGSEVKEGSEGSEVKERRKDGRTAVSEGRQEGSEVKASGPWAGIEPATSKERKQHQLTAL